VTEFHTVKRIDNSRLQRLASPVRLRDFWQRLGAGVAMAGCLLVYTWQHFECIQVRYQIEQLESQRAQVNELNQQLHLEVATLRSPMRVDSIARTQLGLTVPVPGQMAPVDGTADGPADGVVAQERASALAPRP